MWVMTDRGFYSAVQSKTNPDQIVVRGRVRSDLVALVKLVDRKVPIGGTATDQLSHMGGRRRRRRHELPFELFESTER
jgi:hypothetical protein